MVFYKDLSKTVNDLLGDKYNALGAVSLSSKSKTKNGAKLQFKAKKKNGKENVSGGLKWNESFNKDNLTVDLTGEVVQDGTLKEEVVLKGLTKGLKLKLNTQLLQKRETDTEALSEKEEGKKVRNEVKGTLTYQYEKLGLNVSLFKKQLNTPVLSLDLAGEVNENVALGLKVGGKVQKVAADAKRQKVVDTDLTLRLSSEDVTVVGSLTNGGRNVSLGVVSDVNDKLTVGAEFTNSNGLCMPWCFRGKKVEEEAKEKSTEKKWGFTVGLSQKCENNSTMSAKLNDNGVVTCAYDFDVKENLRATVVGETSVKNLGGPLKMGLSLTLSE